jgi:hypothetical protein
VNGPLSAQIRCHDVLGWKCVKAKHGTVLQERAKSLTRCTVQHLLRNRCHPEYCGTVLQERAKSLTRCTVQHLLRNRCTLNIAHH